MEIDAKSAQASMMTNSAYSGNILTSVKQLIAGGVGGVCLILTGHPMDTIKVRIQTMSSPKPGTVAPFNGTLDCVRKTFEHEGLRGFYRGMLAPLIGATPVNAVIFFSYGAGVQLQTGASPTSVDMLSYRQIGLAGMLAGFNSALINAPVERIKCLLQVEQGTSSTAKYKGFWDCTRKVFHDGGVRSLYRGVVATCMRDVPASGVYFLGYEWMKKNAPPSLQANPSVKTLAAGGIAGILFWIVAIPADVIKSRIQTSSQKVGIVQVTRDLVTKHGVTALYRGSTPVFLRAFPANAACFFGYEWTMKALNFLFDS